MYTLRDIQTVRSTARVMISSVTTSMKTRGLSLWLTIWRSTIPTMRRFSEPSIDCTTSDTLRDTQHRWDCAVGHCDCRFRGSAKARGLDECRHGRPGSNVHSALTSTWLRALKASSFNRCKASCNKTATSALASSFLFTATFSGASTSSRTNSRIPWQH